MIQFESVFKLALLAACFAQTSASPIREYTYIYYIISSKRYDLNHPEHSLNHEASSDEVDPYPSLGKPRVAFKSDGTFKITIFSDLHFGENPWDDWGPKQDASSIKLMNTVLSDEKPDYVCVSLATWVFDSCI